MSQRSFRRKHEREIERKSRRTARRIAIATGSAAGAAAIFAPGAQAADFPVTNTNNSGAGSLRQAVINANAAPGPDTVTATSISGTVRLTSGQITITDSVSITGPGSGSLTISGDADASGTASPADSRVFYADEGGPQITVGMKGLTISGGYSDIASYTYMGSTYIYGTDGGGIYSDGAGLSLDDVTLSGNVASDDGGGLAAYVDGQVSITNSKIVNNIAFDDRAGARIGVYGAGAATSVSNSIITGNRGISEDPDPAVTGGGNSSGGGLSTYGSGVTLISGTTISSNSAMSGSGGVSVGSGSSITASTISGNAAGNGGVSIYSNIYAPTTNRPSSIVNSTVADNVAQSSTYTYGGTTYTYGGRGGGVAASGELVSISNSTIAGNSANLSGGGVSFYDYDSASSALDDADNAVTLSSTIVADNTVGGVADDLSTQTNPTTTPNPGLFEAGLSLIESPGAAPLVTTAQGANKTGVDPALSPLADNGGPTQTKLIALTSPAVDAGAANGLSTDQRGLPRTVNGPAIAEGPGSDGTDIGAVELQDLVVTGVKVQAKKKQVQKKKVAVKLKVGAEEAVTAAATGQIKLGKKKLAFKPQSRQVSGGATGNLVLKLKKKSANSKVLKLLAQGKQPKATIAVRFTDVLGNETTGNASVKLKGAKPKQGGKAGGGGKG